MRFSERYFAVGIFVVLFLLALCSAKIVHAQGNSVATVIGVEGQVSVRRHTGGRFSSVGPQELLYFGDTIRATDGGFASILYDDGSQVKLKSGAIIQITKGAPTDTKQSFFKALTGVIWAHMTPNSVVETPSANIIVRGTDILIEISPTGVLTLVVLSGSAEIVTSNGTVTVTSGEETTVYPGGIPSPPIPYPGELTDLTGWTYMNIVIPSDSVTEQVDPYTGTYSALDADQTPVNYSIPSGYDFSFDLPDILIPAIPLSYLASDKNPSSSPQGGSAPAPEMSTETIWLSGALFAFSMLLLINRSRTSLRAVRIRNSDNSFRR